MGRVRCHSRPQGCDVDLEFLEGWGGLVGRSRSRSPTGDGRNESVFELTNVEARGIDLAGGEKLTATDWLASRVWNTPASLWEKASSGSRGEHFMDAAKNFLFWGRPVNFFREDSLIELMAEPVFASRDRRQAGPLAQKTLYAGSQKLLRVSIVPRIWLKKWTHNRFFVECCFFGF